MGQEVESERVLEDGLQLSISHPQLARETALLLVRHNQKDLAIRFLAKAAGDNPDLLLTRAMVLALADQAGSSEALLKEIESKWPEWDRPYLVHGLLLEKRRPSEARQKLQTAIALGAQEITASCALARLASAASADPRCSCTGGVYELLFPPCARP